MFSFNFIEESGSRDQEGNSNSVPQSIDWYERVKQQVALSSSNPLQQIPRSGVGKLVVKRFTIEGLVFRRVADVGEHDIDCESDLIPGVYGGGLKIWECTHDLMKYLIAHHDSLPTPANCKVLELGCGHGFPGIVSLSLGYNDVTFLDLNEEVIRDATWPTIVANKSESNDIDNKNISCLAGDWLSLINKCKER